MTLSDNQLTILFLGFIILFISCFTYWCNSYAFTIYLLWMIITSIVLFTFIVSKIDTGYGQPDTVDCLILGTLYIIILIIVHVLFNSFIYFEPVPHNDALFGSDSYNFCMKSITQADGTTTYTRADIGFPNTFIYIPFTKIHIYNPGKTTYYIDRSLDDDYANYQTLSKDGTLMNVHLHWEYDFCDPDNPSKCGYLIYQDTASDLERVFNKRGPNWEFRYANDITKPVVQNLVSYQSYGSLEVPSWSETNNRVIDVKTDDFKGRISISFEIADQTLRDCYFEGRYNSIGPSTNNDQPVYGEAGESPTYPSDKCAPYDISNEDTSQVSTYYNTPSTFAESPNVNNGLNRVTLRPKGYHAS